MDCVKYNIPYKGLGTEFSQADQPIEYANILTNRFINIFGQAEKRQGLKRFGNQIDSMPNLTNPCEFVDKQNNSTYFVSGEGKIYRYNISTSNWDLVLSGKDSSSVFVTQQMGDKLIFVNGIDRNFYTDNAGATFKELQPLINKGTMGAGTSSTELTDPTITNWSSQTFVSVNDIVLNVNTSAEAIVTSVGSTDLDTSPTGSAATGIGNAPQANQQGNLYQLLDAVELNIIPTNNGPDNVALTTSGTNPNVVAVSGVNFAQTDIREGDYIYNTTRNALTKVISVSANLAIIPISTQIAGDTVTFQKKAMPIATNAHVHYSRIYMIDQRDQTKVRVSGPDDPQDFTTSTKTLASTSIDYGSKYSKGAAMKAISTFGKYLVTGGNGQVFVDDGQTPIADTSAISTDLRPIGNFTQGCVSKYGLVNIGSNMLYLAFDGIRSFKSAYDSNAVDTLNVSEQIKSEIQANIASQIGNDIALQLIHYPKRNWVLCKIGSVIYNYNYTPLYVNGQLVNNGSFSKFNGKFAEQNGYYVANNGDFIVCGPNGLIYKFDNGNYDDDGSSIQTILETAWLSLEEPNNSLNLKKGRYIRPTFETGANIAYTISVIGDFTRTSTDSVVTTADAAGVIGKSVVGQAPIGGIIPINKKLPLSWRGKEFRIRFETNDTNGRDIISSFNIYGQILGRQ